MLYILIFAGQLLAVSSSGRSVLPIVLPVILMRMKYCSWSNGTSLGKTWDNLDKWSWYFQVIPQTTGFLLSLLPQCCGNPKPSALPFEGTNHVSPIPVSIQGYKGEKLCKQQ
jgi:hypothetical protein